MRALRHCLIAWWRNLQANKLLSGIAILGLAVGLTGAILMALVARVPLTFNAMVPDHQRIHLAVSVIRGEGMAPDYQSASPGDSAALIAANVGEVEAATRLQEAEVELRRGNRALKETIFWADPNAFALLSLPVLLGDPDAALRRADGLVMDEQAAVKHFGRTDVLGRTILVDGKPMTVGAVLRDLPPGGSDWDSGIFASGLAAHSGLATLARDAPGSFSISVRTYIRLKPGADPKKVEEAIQPAVAGLVPPPMRKAYRLELVRIDQAALHEGFHPGARQRLIIGSLVAALVLFIATANFVNLTVALSGRRRREIGVRKANGAGRGHIAAQFLGESVLTVLLAALLAVAASEWLIVPVNAFLDAQARFDYLAQPALLLWLLAGVVVLGVAAGAYPAFVVSALSPAEILRDRSGAAAGRSWVRTTLVTGQFAVLIGLIIATAVVQQQRSFAMDEALRLNIDQVLTVTAPCPAAFVAEVEKLPGVRGTACSGQELLTGNMFALVETRGGPATMKLVAALPSTFALYGVKPIAGSLEALPREGEEETTRAVINEAAVRAFGHASPAAAIGKAAPVPGMTPGQNLPARIVAVVPDFTLASIETAVEPTAYLPQPNGGGLGIVSIKLKGSAVPETLREIDRLWRETGQEGPIERAFVSEHLEKLYQNLTRNGQLFAIFSGVAIFLACLGLVGLALSAAERRTKEIGIRKALGASTGQVLRMLLWQMSRPVLLANLIAWPAAWWLMRRWLNGFAYRVDLDLRLFPAAGGIALLVALLSVGSLAWLVARRKPVHALRYE